MQLNKCWSVFPVPVLPSFDLLGNGGGSLTLRFERAPFLSQERTVWLPWNRFYAMDTVVLQTEEKTTARCDLSGFVRPDPMVLPSPLSSFFSSNPSERHILPESQVPHSTPPPSLLISFIFTFCILYYSSSLFLAGLLMLIFVFALELLLTHSCPHTFSQSWFLSAAHN